MISIICSAFTNKYILLFLNAKYISKKYKTRK